MNKQTVRRIKRCSVCKKNKRLSSFRKYKPGTHGGLRPLCKPCQRKYEKKWRSMSKEKLRKMRWARSAKASEYSRNRRAEFRAEYLVGEIRRRCVRRGIRFNLIDHIDEIRERIKSARCELTGYPLDLLPTKTRWERKPNAPSIDRIKPNLGYVINNIRIVCLAVNCAMSNWGEERFLPIAKAWITARKTK